MSTLRWTPARLEALEALVSPHPGSARVSNRTVAHEGLVYWQAADWLLEHGFGCDAYGTGGLGWSGERPTHIFATDKALAEVGEIDP